jgi:hypothetical protein
MFIETVRINAWHQFVPSRGRRANWILIHKAPKRRDWRCSESWRTIVAQRSSFWAVRNGGLQ